MPSKLSWREVRALSLTLSHICEGILFRAGPFLKEGIYQDLLVHELDLQHVPTSREVVFNYQFQDSKGNDILLGNNQCLRSDIELPLQRGIIEVKSSTSSTKMETMWQLRNYLEQRPDRSWGVILNFISKYGVNAAPKVQCDTIYKGSMFTDIDLEEGNNDSSLMHSFNAQGTDGKEYIINRYYSEHFYSKEYPREDMIFTRVNNSPNKDNDTDPLR